MNTLIIGAQYISETAKQDLSDLAYTLKQELNLEVKFGIYSQRGYAVTWWEVINVWMPAGGIYLSGKILDKLIDRFLDWAEKRIETEKKEKNGKKARPKCITIYGPDGKAVSSVVLYDNGDKKRRTQEELKNGYNKLPPNELEFFQ
ncbi:hypothetical protein ACFSKU_17390 [Pontibacter silvestris]|uniref:Uncharacterized protein n=1 Tax=Pontibacter silvestris TaxID=2305183 RepID=A0ABW4X3D6_9BACT|nr:hypothetical protein [Pontibacter silvestris]MCC9135798.1 hypothetical protein [Pontibacter silvestris]